MQTTALNYTPAAIEDLRTWRGHFRSPASQQALGMLADALRRSETFLLPEDASLLDVPDVQPHYVELLRLPYPLTVLEFITTPERNGGSGKGLVLCLDGTQVGGLGAEDGNPADVVAFIPLFWSSRLRMWHPTAHVFQFNRTRIELVDGKIVAGLHHHEFLPEMLESMSPEQADQDADMNLKFALDAVIEFCLTVNCENVRHVELPPPPALNKKRLKHGKEALFTYKILTIPGEASGDHAGAGGDRQGPRLHLRRGHLRRLQSGSIVWVRHALVGTAERGVVAKDYRVTTP